MADRKDKDECSEREQGIERQAIGLSIGGGDGSLYAVLGRR
jgi:hypothetical protein